MHIHIDACTHVYTHRIPTCIHTYIHIFMPTHTLIYIHIFIHSFILNIYIAPFQENYSEALPTLARLKKQCIDIY